MTVDDRAGYSRREFGRLALTGVALSMSALSSRLGAIDSTVRGVKLGAITGVYGPFNAAPGQDVIDVVIQRSIAGGVGHVELVNGLIEPRTTGGGVGGQAPEAVTPEYTKSREELRQWRITTPLDRFREIRKKFDAASVNLYSYVMTIGDDFTDPEIDAVFRHMQALGVDKFCTNQTRVAMGRRMAPFAEKYRIKPAFHPHAQVHDPNEVASPESLRMLLAMSPQFMINLDIGHYTRGGNDPFAFLKEYPNRITHLHVRDARDGKAVNIGTGTIKVKEMLQFVRDNKHDVGFILEQGGTGFADSVEAARANIAYMRGALES